jgi:XTP/dITP diphosphohydrolase
VSFKLGVGTGNAHKLAEFQRILGPLLPGVELVASTGESPEETGASFSDNALIKARAAHLNTGLPAIADDSGIRVDALGGAPGIYSQRYSPSGTDHDNTRLLLENMAGVSARDAEFVCAAALVFDGGEIVVERTWPGTIATDASGAEGFGYDPVFIPRGLTISSAQLSPQEKDAISHRGQAFRELAEQIRSLLS